MEQISAVLYVVLVAFILALLIVMPLIIIEAIDHKIMETTRLIFPVAILILLGIQQKYQFSLSGLNWLMVALLFLNIVVMLSAFFKRRSWLCVVVIITAVLCSGVALLVEIMLLLSPCGVQD